MNKEDNRTQQLNDEMTDEEIQQLSKKAEQERGLHNMIIHDIQALRGLRQEDGSFPSIPLSAERQMQILTRGRRDEIMRMLGAYSELTRVDAMGFTPQAQMYIYENGRKTECPDVMAEALKFMLEYCYIHYPVEEKLIDNAWSIWFDSNSGKFLWPRKKKMSAKAEIYIIQKTKSEASWRTKDTTGFLKRYMEYKLEPEAEAELIQLLKVTNARDSTIQNFQQLVRYYMKETPLSAKGQRALVATGDHDFIVFFIKEAPKSFTDQSAIDALKKRRNREEIETFYARYAIED